MLYPEIDDATFDAVFGLFKWSTQDSADSLKMFQLTMVALMTGAGSSLEDDIDMSFEIFDSDHSGSLDKEEFMTMMKATFATKMNSLKLVMHTDSGREALLEFASSEFSDENVRFLRAAEEWKDNGRGSEAAKILFETYLIVDAPQTVNISGKTRKMLAKAFDDLMADSTIIISPDFFDVPMTEVYQLVEKDTFMRFRKKTDTMDELFEQIFLELDSSGDQLIQKEEYLEWVRSHPESLAFMTDLHSKVSSAQQKSQLDLEHPVHRATNAASPVIKFRLETTTLDEKDEDDSSDDDELCEGAIAPMREETATATREDILPFDS